MFPGILLGSDALHVEIQEAADGGGPLLRDLIDRHLGFR
jgi:hypothetical protein